MDIEYITKLIELVAKSGVDEIEIEEDGKKIRIAKTLQASAGSQATVFNVAQPAAQVGVPQAPQAPMAQAPVQSSQPTPALPPASSTKQHEVKSPIVGTFYRAASPDASPFVQVGSTVQKGSALCIIEAMKLLNEIESDVAGKIVQIMVENGQPVEYDQVLFMIEPV